MKNAHSTALERSVPPAALETHAEKDATEPTVLGFVLGQNAEGSASESVVLKNVAPKTRMAATTAP
jgi:hypothetical protein